MWELPGDGGTVLVGRVCDEVTCEGMVTFRQAGAPGKVKSLPKSKNALAKGGETPFYGVQPYFAELRDVDGDGQRELVVAYTVVGTERPEYGSYIKDWVAVLNVPDFELGFAEVISEHGAENEPACGANLYITDLDDDKHNELIIERQCGRLKDLMAGKAGEPEHVPYFWDAKSDRYRRLVSGGVSAGLENQP
jgi:hypothetical protein